MSTIEVVSAVKSQRPRKLNPIEYTEFELGSIHWQGDVGILRISKVPEGARKINNEAQLAPGTSRGSRHLIHEACVFTMYRDGSEVTDGPVVDASTKLQVVHPDHGTVVMPPGIYKIVYQRQLSGDRIERVLD